MVVQGKLPRRRHHRRARRRARRRDRRAHPGRDACSRASRSTSPSSAEQRDGPRVIRDLDDPEFGRLFTDVRRSWFRLETLQRYDVEYERDALRGIPARRADRHHARAVAGDDPRARRRRARARARARRSRSRSATTSATNSRRTRPNVEAGEDVRVIPVRARRLAGGRAAARLLALRRRAPLAHGLRRRRRASRPRDSSTIPAAVEQHRRWRDTALAQSIPLTEYTTAHQPA